MSDIAEQTTEDGAKPRRRPLLLILAIVGFLAAGFGTTFMGLWNPLAFFQEKPEPVAEDVSVTFVEIPQIALTMPGARARTLVLSTKIEVAPEKAKEVSQLLPRIQDSFNTFLSEVDPAAYEKRGILEIIRTELATRLAFILGEDGFDDLLITEFRIQ